MQPELIAAGAGGLVLGFAIAFFIAKSSANRAIAERESKIKEQTDKLEQARKDAATHLEKERSRAAEAEKKAAAQKEHAAGLEQSLEQNKGQLKQLQAAIQDLEAMRSKSNAQLEAHAAARQQAEGKLKQAELSAAQSQQALAASQAELQAATAKAAELNEVADRRNREVQKLRGEVAALKRDAAGPSVEESVDAFADTDGSLDGILRQLMEHEAQRAAVLADANGIIVAAVGETGLKEGMAATSQLVGSIATQLVDMVPFSSVRCYMLTDTQNNVLAGRAFMCQGEMVGLVTYGSRLPGDRVLDGAMASLSAALE